MTNFIGDYTCKVDEKGRIIFPSALKKQIQEGTGEKFVIKKDIYEKCLVLYTIEEWERQNKIIREKINPYNREHNKFLRTFFKGTAEVTLDNNNRLLIPKRLLDEIGANKEVVLAGQFNKIEIWAKEDYDKIGCNEQEYIELAEKILGNNN